MNRNLFISSNSSGVNEKTPEELANLHYFNIVPAACTARLTSQKGSNVPIASVPSAAIPRPIHENQLRLPGSGSCSTGLCEEVDNCGSFVLGVFTATAVPAVARPPVVPRAGVRLALPDVASTGVAGTPGAAPAGALSCSINMVAVTRR